MMEWKEELQQHTKEAEKIVQGYLPEETGHQKLLIEASNYSVLVGGKRLRPMIMLESFKAFGGTGNVGWSFNDKKTNGQCILSYTENNLIII